MPEKFDAWLTQQWIDAIADALDEQPTPTSLIELLARHPELRDGKLFGGRGS